MKSFYLACAGILLFTGITNAQQRVGIGTSNPQMPLHVTRPADTALLLLENQTTLATDENAGLYFKTGAYHTGAIKTIGNGTNTARLALFSFASAIGPNSLKEGISLMDNGSVGIGNNNPQYKLDVSGNLHVATNTVLDGSLKIAGGAPAAGKVLTSDAAGNASWRSQAYGNTERFFIKTNDGTTYTTTYNLGTAVINSNGQVTIGKSGLYHLEAMGELITTEDYTQAGATARVGSLNMLANNAGFASFQNDVPFMKIRIFSNPVFVTRYAANMQGSMEVYLAAGTIISVGSVVLNGTATETGSLRGHLIAE